MRLPNFGKKCLAEAVALFAQENLSLGLCLPDWTAQREDETPIGKTALAPDQHTESTELDATQKAFLVQPLSRFNFSTRVSNIINRERLKRVADLATLPSRAERRPKGLGDVALQEINKFLSDNGLSLGIDIPNWGEALAAEWEQDCAAEMERGPIRPILDLTSREEVSSNFLEDELQQLAGRVLADCNERRTKIVTRFFGFDGTGKKTLEEVAKEFGITRERVRQVADGFKRRVGKYSVRIPTFRHACTIINDNLPVAESHIRQKLRDQRITAVEFNCTSILAVLSLLNEDPPFSRVSRLTATILSVRLKWRRCSTAYREFLALLSVLLDAHISSMF